MKFVGARFRNDVDLPSAVSSVFRIEVAGEDAELGDGVEIGNDRRPRVHVFFGVGAVHDERIRKLPLAVDRNRSRVQSPGGRKRADADVLLGVGSQRGYRNDAGLEGKQIGIAPPIQGHRGHFRAADDLAHLRIGGFRVYGALAYGDRLRLFANLQHDVHNDRAVGVDGDTGPLVGLEACPLDYKVVATDGEVGKGVESLAVGYNVLLDSRVGVGRLYGCARNHGVACVLHRAGDAPAKSGARDDGEKHEEGKRKK